MIEHHGFGGFNNISFMTFRCAKICFKLCACHSIKLVNIHSVMTVART